MGFCRRAVDLARRGIKHCRHCRTIRLLEPERCPPDCDSCGAGGATLAPANVAALELYHNYPSLLQFSGMGGGHVDYHAAWRLAEEEGIDDPLLLRRLEAIKTGLLAKEQGGHGR